MRRSSISAAAWPRASPIRASLRRIAAGARAASSTAGLPPTAFVSFLQNHDQIGNRAFGERLTALAEPAALRRRGRDRAARAFAAAAVHGRGIRRDDAVPVLLRFRSGRSPRRCAPAGARSSRASRASRDAASAAAIPDPQSRRRPSPRASSTGTPARAPSMQAGSNAIASCCGSGATIVIPMLAKIDPRRCGFAIDRCAESCRALVDRRRRPPAAFRQPGRRTRRRAGAAARRSRLYDRRYGRAGAELRRWSTTWLLVDDRTEATGDA